MLYFCSLPKEKQIGLSPSGKATDFDSVTRGFESRQPSHVGAKSALLRLFFQNSRRCAPLLLLPEKGHARVACSLASALTTALARYQPFSVKSAPLALIHGADFPFYRLPLYLLRKPRLHLSGCRSSSAKSHARLGCSVASALADASLSLPAFCGITFTRHPCSSSPKKRSHSRRLFACKRAHDGFALMLLHVPKQKKNRESRPLYRDRLSLQIWGE